MMLLGNLFHIIELNIRDAALTARIELDPAHPIFTGHFPGRPILPGVCQLQIMEEILSHALDRKLKLKSIAQVKFLVFIDPETHRQLDVNIKLKNKENSPFSAEGSYIWGETVFLKVKAEFDEYGDA